MLDGLGGFLLDLHRASRDVPYPRFQDWVFEHLRAVVRFDSAWWGSGSNEPPRVHRVHLHGADPSILDDYRNWIEHDFFRAAVAASPGRTVLLSDLIERAEFERSALYREFARPHRIEWSMGTVLVEPVSSLSEFLTVWRHDPGDPFSEQDRRIKQFLMPHLSEAHRHCRVAHLRDPAGRRRSVPWAICDADGLLQDVHPSFSGLLREEWPDWRHARLPGPLCAALSQDKRYVGGRIVVDHRPAAGLLLLEGRYRTAIDTLTPREHQIATRYAAGATHADIARLLNLSPSTVRNQVYRAFRKLHVNNKSELLFRLYEATGLPAGQARELLNRAVQRPESGSGDASS